MSAIAGAAIAGGAALLGGIGNLFSQANTNKTNKYLAQQQNEYNLELQNRQFQHNTQASELEYQRNLEQWNRENEYNTPSAQMQRYIEAGLNPNLIYGTGSASAGNASSSPQYTAARYQAPKAERANLQAPQLNINPYQAVSIGNQLAIQKAQADQIEAQADYTRAQTRLAEADLPWRDVTHNLSTRKLTQDIDNITQDFEFKKARMKLLPYQEQFLKQQLKNLRTSDDINQLELKLRKIGITSSDDLWQRIAARIFAKYGSFGLSKSVDQLFD